jgi:hypothetical protein
MAINGLDSMIAAFSAGQANKGLFQKTTVNGATSAAGRWHEFFTANGIPTAGAFSGTAGVATQMTGATQGAFNVGTASVSPDTKNLVSLKIQSPTATLVPATFYLVDYLLYYPACVVTGTPTVLNNTATLPRYTNGEGVMAMIAVQSALGATQPVLTLTYTDDGGTGSNVGLALTSPVNSAPVSTLFLNNGSPFLPLATTDNGVRSINSYTLASGTTGTVAMVLVKVLAEIDLYAINTGVMVDYVSQMPSFPKIEDNACLGLIGVPGGAMVASSVFSGTIQTVWD